MSVLCTAVLTLAWLATLAAAATPAATPAPTPSRSVLVQEEGEEIRRLEAWPEPSDEDALKKEVQRLRKARTEVMGEEARDALIAEGAAVVPFLLPALAREKDAAARERVLHVLDRVTDARHTRLLAKEFGARDVRVREWALRRAARFPDPGVAQPAAEALARALAKPKKAGPEEPLLAALCLTGAGSLDGLEVLRKGAGKDWKKIGPDVRRALEVVRGPAATRAVAGGLEGDRDAVVTALRFLAGCGDASAVTLVRPHLDSSDRGVQLAAINALRGIVDGEPPVEKLPVFEMIERAKKWKERV